MRTYGHCLYACCCEREKMTEKKRLSDEEVCKVIDEFVHSLDEHEVSFEMVLRMRDWHKYAHQFYDAYIEETCNTSFEVSRDD